MISKVPQWFPITDFYTDYIMQAPVKFGGVSCICRQYWRRMFYRNSVVISLNVCWESISKNYFYFKLNEHSKGNTTYCNCTGCFEWLCRTVYYVCGVGYSVLYYCCWLYKALLLNWTKHFVCLCKQKKLSVIRQGKSKSVKYDFKSCFPNLLMEIQEKKRPKYAQFGLDG